MVRAKYSWELARGVPRKQSRLQRITTGGLGPKKRGPKNPKRRQPPPHKFKTKEEFLDPKRKLVMTPKKVRKFHRKRIKMTRPFFWQLGEKPKGYNMIKTSAQKKSVRLCKLRKSLTPGTVVILLSGKALGKRVIFLKQLEKSGLLLVCGPKRANGYGLRRVAQSYVIATSKKVCLKRADLSRLDEVTDEFFTINKKFNKNREWLTMVKKRKFIATEENPEFKPHAIYKCNELARLVNKELWKCVKPHVRLRQYLNSKFRLGNTDRPHLMRF